MHDDWKPNRTHATEINKSIASIRCAVCRFPKEENGKYYNWNWLFVSMFSSWSSDENTFFSLRQLNFILNPFDVQFVQNVKTSATKTSARLQKATRKIEIRIFVWIRCVRLKAWKGHYLNACQSWFKSMLEMTPTTFISFFSLAWKFVSIFVLIFNGINDVLIGALIRNENIVWRVLIVCLEFDTVLLKCMVRDDIDSSWQTMTMKTALSCRPTQTIQFDFGISNGSNWIHNKLMNKYVHFITFNWMRLKNGWMCDVETRAITQTYDLCCA